MLFDTNVIIWALRGNLRAAAAIDRAGTLELSIVSFMELVRGARDKRELLSIKAALTNLDFETLPLTENVGRRASIYMEEYALRCGIGIPDALIAATAIEASQPLCTANAKVYRAIVELDLKPFRP